MWGRVKKALKGLDPVRVENKAEKGTPDVWYKEGALELKWKRKMPKGNGILNLDHDMTQEQRVWHIRRHHAGGKCYVLIKISTLWLLLKGVTAAEFLGKVDLTTLKEKADRTWQGKLVDSELRAELTKN